MTIRSSDPAQHAALMEVIGRVVSNSAVLSQMFEQLAATVMGTTLVVFLFEDKTLGTQREMVEKMVIPTNTNPHGRHPGISDADRLTVLDILKECSLLIQYRNRVAHDTWAAWPSDDAADHVEGRRPTRWGRSHVVSTTRSLRILADHLNQAAAALGTMEQKIAAERAGQGDRVSGSLAPQRFLDACAERRAGTTKDWYWDEIESLHRPRRGMGPISIEAD